MKKFKEYISVPKQGIGYSRDTLPQIEYNRLGFFLQYMRELGIIPELIDNYPISNLKPSQDDFDLDKISKMMNKEFDPRGRILISQDDYVMDGHHRWAAEYNKHGPYSNIGVWKFPCNILDLINNAKVQSQ